VRLEKTCRYPPDSTILDPTALDQETLLHRIRGLEHRPADLLPNLDHESDTSLTQNDRLRQEDLEAASVFPRAFFLDAEFFAPLPRSPITHRIHLPPEALEQIDPDPLAVCNHYLASIHTWLPIVSQKRLFQQATCFKELRDPSTAALLLSAKLVANPGKYDTRDEGCRLYSLGRKLLNDLEDACKISLNLLQSTFLIALYEIGHGIFPAAYLTVGRAARLASLMGLTDRRHSTQLFKAADTWTLREEERRAWWATFILERYRHVSSPIRMNTM
jgi:hypothetical protein